MREYLLRQLEYDLGIQKITLDEDGWDSEPIPEYQSILDEEMKVGKKTSIPYWEEMILYWSSGWASLGRQYLYPESGPRPIVAAGDLYDNPNQKRFQMFE